MIIYKLLTFLFIMEVNLSFEKLIEYKTAFESFKKGASGQILTKDLGRILRNLGQNPNIKELQEIIVEVDADGSGTIDFGEFIGLIIKRTKQNPIEDEIIEAFNYFDKDGNKILTSNEMRNVLENIQEIPKEEIEEMIKEADYDNDGEINFQEFIKLMND